MRTVTIRKPRWKKPWHAFDRLIRAGKVRAIGASNLKSGASPKPTP